ncbi:hypothetical protein Athai_55660 [Actinocatenispora thailandica]|uniref:Uncharacterized protein n=1 Tax=Actinocatenispora thailandica TaxID=227318 RepID=A0A7R7I0I2_9ACTN|nr:hypothetical protein [Actinocatenispora thailandica]BCJ38063.1 hypothetical protein Athai_55660 [Actinocatenispora thailandica]
MAKSRPTATYVLSADDIRAGDQVFISPAAGVHGHGCWWAMVVSRMPALVDGAVYLRVVPVDQLDADPAVTVFYARLSGLLVRRMP